MIRITLALIACSVFTGCMTQADKALWAEAKLTMSGDKEQAATAAAPEEVSEPAKAVKTSKDSKDKEKEESNSPVKDEDLQRPTRAN